MMAGYISFGSDVPDFVIAREPLEGSQDLLMSFGQVGLFIGLVVSTSLRMISNLDNFHSLFKKDKNDDLFVQSEDTDTTEEGERSMLAKIITYLVCFLVPYIFSLLLGKDVNTIISLASSIFCPFFIIIFPALLNIKLKNQFKYNNRDMLIINAYMYTFSGILLISIIINIVNVFKGSSVVG